MKPVRLPVGTGQESVWDYPRPPRLERTNALIEIVFAGLKIVSTRGAFRVLETSHPPTYYIPPGDIAAGVLQARVPSSFCEWKGRANAFDVVVASAVAQRAAWTYPRPSVPFAALAEHVAFYAQPMDSCLVDGEQVTPQPGGFYGGWITAAVVGPFKGGPGTMGW